MGVGTSRSLRDIVFTLERKSSDIAWNIFLQNGVLSVMGLQKRVKIVKGGNRFDERTQLGQNSTVGNRSRFTQIPTDFQNNWLTAEYGRAICSGAAVVNMVDVQENAAKSKLDDIANKTLEEAQLTFPNVVSDALMKTTPGVNDPQSIVNVIEATAFGSQTSTTGGIARSAHTGLTDSTDAWQNQYSAQTALDVSGAAGKGALTSFAWACSPGGGANNQQPDIGLTTTGVMAKISGAEDNLKRYQPSDKMATLGFVSFMVNQASLIADRNVTAGYLYFLNTNYLRFQVLAGPNEKSVGNVQTIGDGRQAIPLQVSDAVESDDHLNYTIKLWLVYNLTLSGLRQHGLMTGITEA